MCPLKSGGVGFGPIRALLYWVDQVKQHLLEITDDSLYDQMSLEKATFLSSVDF